MLVPLLLLFQAPSTETIAKIDALAKARDVAGLSAYLAPYTGRNPLGPIKTGGCYGTGRFGWRAMYVNIGGTGFVVFTTPLTSEDIGELLFKFDSKGKLVYIPESDINGFQITSHEFNIRFDVQKKTAMIQDRLRMQVVAERHLPPMLRLGPNYRVSKIVDSHGTPIAFLQAGGIVCLMGAVNVQDLTLTYSAIVDRPEFAGSISDKEIMLTNDYWWPMIGRQPAPYTLTATVPGGWTPVAQGELISETATAAGTKATFEMKVPVSYYSFSAAPYASVVTKKNGREFRMWSTSLTKGQMELQNELYPPIIAFYEQFAKYPFSGWGAVVSQVYGGGALEAYSFATYGGGLPGEDGHETAHTWWGGLISNSYLNSMWNESFANFSDGFYQRNVEIGNVAERRLAFIDTPDVSPEYTAAPVSEASPFIGPAASTIGYGKGSYVLQMLETEIGTDLMVKAMREWQRAQPPLKAGEWRDFEAALARTPGIDVQWFTSQWLDRPGWVDFDVENLKWNAGALVGEVVFKTDPYLVNCEVLIVEESGKQTFVKAPLAKNLRDKRQRFAVPCLQKPKVVSFDPWRRILRPIHEDETPVELSDVVRVSKRFTDSNHADWLSNIGSRQAVDSLPQDLDGMFIVGHPSSVPRMKELCQKAGFAVNGNKLTYQGTEIDLEHGAALAVVNLGAGKSCVIGLGKTRRRPSFGHARLAVVDDLGRFLRGKTDPKTAGYLTYSGF